MRLSHITPLLAVAVLPMLLRAQEASVAARTRFTTDLGFVQTSGNTEITTFNIGEKLSREWASFTLAQSFALVYGEERGTVNSNALRTDLRGDWRVGQRLALFLGAGFDRNSFAGIERRFEEQIGLRSQVIAAARDTVSVEAGGTVTQQLGTEGTTRNFPAARAAGVWRHAFNDRAYLQQNAEVLPNLSETEDWRVNTETTLVAPLSARVGMKLSYVLRYDNLPEPGFRTTDRLFTTGIQLTFD